jgi:hypothetical protein
MLATKRRLDSLILHLPDIATLALRIAQNSKSQKAPTRATRFSEIDESLCSGLKSGIRLPAGRALKMSSEQTPVFEG